MKIYKLTIKVTGEVTEHQLPADAQIISCGFQGTDLVAWYIFNDEVANDPVPFNFRTFKTGPNFDSSFWHLYNFVGTAVCREYAGYFVVHLFYRKRDARSKTK